MQGLMLLTVKDMFDIRECSISKWDGLMHPQNSNSQGTGVHKDQWLEIIAMDDFIWGLFQRIGD